MLTSLEWGKTSPLACGGLPQTSKAGFLPFLQTINKTTNEKIAVSDRDWTGEEVVASREDKRLTHITK